MYSSWKGLCSGHGNSVVVRELSLYPQSLLAKLTVRLGLLRLSPHHGTKRCVYVHVRNFWSVAMMISIRGENGSRAKGKRRRGREGGGGGYDFLDEHAYVPQSFSR